MWNRPPRTTGEDIAVVGLACRYPEADTPQELWENVLSQRRSFRQMPPSRLRAEDYVFADRSIPDATYTALAGLLTGYQFDRVKFRISGATFRATDLTHWLALEVTSEALADAGFPEGDGLPRDATGVIVGNTLTGEMSRAQSLRLRWPFVRRVVSASLRDSGVDADHVDRLLAPMERAYKAPFSPIGEDSLAGALSNTIAGRICNFFDLKGGGWTVDGACSSSLLAAIAVCGQLGSGDIDVGIAGGVDISIDPFELVGFAKTGALAPTEMRVYDRRSSGFWPGEGCGVTVLMRAADAVAQGRRVYARIRGWGVSSDGAGGITRPTVAGQVMAMRRAYERAGVNVERVAYVEGHGTGTPLGDRVELDAVATYRRESQAGSSVVVGSIKANIGHTKAAAGMAGLIKTAMALRVGVLPPNTGCEQPHELVADGAGPITVLRDARPWPADRPFAGLSGMGFGGINAHIVLEAASSWKDPRPAGRTAALVRTPQDAELFLFGATDPEDLAAQVHRMTERVRLASWGELRDLAGALASRASGKHWRLALVARSTSELQTRLEIVESLLPGALVENLLEPTQGVFLGAGLSPARLGFLFPGQGVTPSLDGGAWSRRFPRVAAIYREAGISESDLGGGTSAAQPAIVTAYLAGRAVLDAVGVHATLAVGHSLGELCAYQWAGAMGAADLLSLVRARAAAMESTCPPGTTMASLEADIEATRSLLAGGDAVIAAVNSSTQVVVAGLSGDVNEVTIRARQAGLSVVTLRVAHAFHTPLMHRAGEMLEEDLRRRTLNPLRQQVVSTVTGRRLEPDADLRQLLVRHITGPVLFREAALLAARDVDAFVEVGPGRVLCDLVQRLRPSVPLEVGGGSLYGLLCCVGTAHALGLPIRPGALFEDRVLRTVDVDRSALLLGNPCEAVCDDVPPPNTPAVTHSPRTALGHRPSDIGGIVRALVASRAELPLDAVGDDDRLLDDLHMSSVTVGQIAQEAMDALGLSSFASPTSFANATVQELCDAIADLKVLRPGPSRADKFEGIGPWVRAFRIDLRSAPRPVRADMVSSGNWNVLSSPGTRALAEELRSVLPRATGRSGVAVCLPSGPSTGDSALLLRGTHEALASRANVLLVVQHGGGGTAFARSVFQEHPSLAVHVVDLAAGIDHVAAANAAAEAAAGDGLSEVRVAADGTRRTPVLVPVPHGTGSSTAPLSAGDVVLVTGGARGIGMECALSLGRATGARLGLLGRSKPGTDPVLDANLARFTQAGLKVAYERADVADADEVREAITALQTSLGPVTAVIHAAGINVPVPVAHLEQDQVVATLAPKIDGLRNIIAAIDVGRLHLLVAFGSLIGCTGLRGEAHYGLANEWLGLEVERMQVVLPACRCLTLEWSLWSGVGMAERLGVVEALSRDGIEAIPIEQAVSAMAGVLWRPELTGRIVMTGRFGAASESAFERTERPLLRYLERVRIHYPGIEVVADAELGTESDPYLTDHEMDGNRVVPAALLLEAMAQATRAVTGTTGTVSFHDVDFCQPVVVAARGRQWLRVAALADTDSVEAVVRTGTNSFVTDHVRAVCQPTPVKYGDAKFVKAVPEVGRLPSVDVDTDLYGSLLFQGGRFHRIRRYRQLGASRCLAEVEVRDDSWFGPFHPAELVLGDPGVHDAALHCVQACIPNVQVLPVGAGSIMMMGRLPHDRVLVAATEQARSDDEFRYDIDIVAPDGRLCERWTDVRFRKAARPLPISGVPDSLVAIALERRVQDLLSDGDIRLAVEFGEGKRRERSDAAFSRLLEKGTYVSRAGDGRPYVDGHRLSAAHTRGLTVAVAGSRPVACDVELIWARTEAEWRTLLGPTRWQLAEIAGRTSGLTSSAAGALVWAAGECLAKAGLAPHSHLSLASSFPDRWLILASANYRIAATALDRGDHGDVALAVLAERR